MIIFSIVCKLQYLSLWCEKCSFSTFNLFLASFYPSSLSCRLWLVLSPCNFSSVPSSSHSRWALGHITSAGLFFMVVQGYALLFILSCQEKSHSWNYLENKNFLQYQATGRGFVVRHIKFTENYRLYSRSHFVKGSLSLSLSHPLSLSLIVYVCVCVCVSPCVCLQMSIHIASFSNFLQNGNCALAGGIPCVWVQRPWCFILYSSHC